MQTNDLRGQDNLNNQIAQLASSEKHAEDDWLYK
jgi:hypothetical protein